MPTSARSPTSTTTAPAVPEAADGRPRFIGTPEQLVADVEAFVAAGVDHFALRFWAGTPGVEPAQVIEQMRLFAELVVAEVGEGSTSTSTSTST